MFFNRKKRVLSLILAAFLVMSDFSMSMVQAASAEVSGGDTGVVTELPVEEDSAVEVFTEETPAAESPMQIETQVYINPLYKDIIDVGESEQSFQSPTQVSSENQAYAIPSYQTLEEIGAALRTQMVARATAFEFKMPSSLYGEEFLGAIINIACLHTEDCTGQEGDALSCGYKRCSMGGSISGSTATMNLTLEYHTTATQEQELTTAVNAAMTEMNLSGKSDAEKIQIIHDYICDHVNYDYNYEKYSAYDALCTGSSVCQGYAILTYRLCKEAGIPVRIITGIGNGGAHAWNIVKVGDYYYNIDCTWDGQGDETLQSWFLLNEADFSNHTRGAEFDTAEFHAQYPMAQISYGFTWPEPLNIANLELTFTELDGSTFTTTTNGKPKLLIFYKSDCPNSLITIQDIGRNITEFAQVDICAIEVYSADKATIQNVKDSYCSQGMKFSVGAEINSMWKYVTATGTNSASFPVLCYIDANNKFQYMTMESKSSAGILNALRQYCNYTYSAPYTITYELNGGTNHPNNPATYTVDTETFDLWEPTKENCSFAGWYLDSAFTQKVTKITKGSKGNLILYAKWNKAAELVLPAKTSYFVGESFDGAGGIFRTYDGETAVDTALTDSKVTISGFDSTAEGVCTVTATLGETKLSFEVLIVSQPTDMNLVYGVTLAETAAPISAYGTYAWKNPAQVLKLGENTVTLVFTPSNENFTGLTTNILVTTKGVLSEENTTVTLNTKVFTYTGEELKPAVTVTYAGKVLKANTEYTLSYSENINAGTAGVTVTGVGSYEGTLTENYIINPAPVIIWAEDLFLSAGEELPGNYTFGVSGLLGTDSLITNPQFTCEAENTETPGEYAITPFGADAGKNYSITYRAGTLLIAEENVVYEVQFDMQGHGETIPAYFGITAGSTITAPAEPVAEGYTFAGWYKDTAYKNAWNFEMDIVQSDIILYAKWVEKNESGFSMQEIKDVTYTGKIVKPVVNVYDGDILLKSGRDYTIQYVNNKDVNKDRIWKTGNGGGEHFNPELPYVIITGRGNYKDSVKVNFNIRPAVIGTEDGTEAKGVILKYVPQLEENAKRVGKPFTSIKSAVAMKEGRDFTLTLTAVNAADSEGAAVAVGTVMSGAVVPAGYSGNFLLTIEGCGNYSGTIEKSIYVADKSHLIKNATITLGNNCKKAPFKEGGVILRHSHIATADTFTVKSGKTMLNYGLDYTIDFRNNDKVGKAELIITGCGDYVGSKTVTFEITGKKFSTSTVQVTGLNTMDYTGLSLTQNKVELTYKDKSGVTPLVYGKDYTISYSKNINKGNATITFTGVSESGYTGKVQKTFKIQAVDLGDTAKVERGSSLEGIVAEFTKTGAQPKNKISLSNKASGLILKEGRDYTVSFKNNKKTGLYTDEKAPLMVIKGKGHYSGTLEIPFTIVKSVVTGSQVRITPVAYVASKKANYEYKPAITIMDGKSRLAARKDYQVEYVKNTQADYEAYMEKLEAGTATYEDTPRVLITAAEGSNYEINETITLPIYQSKLTKNNLLIEVEPAIYTGSQCTPGVTVRYLQGEETHILKEGIDFEVSYGTNVAAGRNKGSLTITGISPKYGGSVTMKFDITSKQVLWK